MASTEAKEASPCRCSECGMLFQRKDHLRRHIVLHKGRKPFVCFICNRRFSRRDTLERHESIHDILPPHQQPPKSTGKTRGEKACASCRLSKQRCDGAEPCSRCVRKHRSCQYLPRRARQTSRWRMHTNQTPSATAKDFGDFEDMSMTSWLEKSPPLGEEQYTPQAEPSTNPSEETVSVTSHGSTLGAGLQQSVVLGDVTFNPSHILNSAWEEGHTTGWADVQVNDHLPTALSSEPPELPLLVDPAFESMAGSLATCGSWPTEWLSSPWLPQPFGQSGWGPISTASPGSLDAELEDFGHVEGLSTKGYENLDLWARMMSTTWENWTPSSSESTRLPPMKALNVFIQLYFEKFHDTLPIIHPPTFDPSSAPCLLVLAVANIGRRFSRLAERFSNDLDLEKLVHDTIKRHIETFQTSEIVPLWLAQAVLLCQIGMSFTNSMPTVERSQVTSGVLDIVLKKLEPSLGAAAASILRERESSDDQALWKAWIHCETLRRTVYGLWLLDSQCCLFFDLTPAVPTEALQIPLPCHEGLWKKTTASSWKTQWTKTKEMPTLRVEMQSLYSLNPVSGDVGAFAFLVILFGFFRDQLFLKQAEDTGLLAVVNMHGERITYGMVRRSDLWKLLDPFKRPESNLANAVAIQYYHMIGIVLNVPLKVLLAFSGWRVTRLRQQETRRKLMAWSLAHGDSARGAALHAGALFRQCWCRSTSGYQEPGAILIATLALWVYNSSLPRCTLAGQETHGEKQRTPNFHLDNETDQDEVLDWIRNGKPARPFVVGVGNIHAPGSYSKAVKQATNFLASLKEWPISQLFSSAFKDLLVSFEKESV